MKTKADIVLDCTQEPPVIRCLRCGRQEAVTLPPNLTVMAKTFKRWDKMHANCKP
jgi:hypothetical protein